MTQQDAALLFPQVLKPIAESRFLSTTDLGRLLLLTSKSMTAAALEQGAPREGGDQEPARKNNAVWKCLCFTHWGFDDASALMETMKPLSAEQCFRKLAVVSDDHDDNKFPVPRALQYAPKDYVLIVSVRESKNDKNMFCKAIPGQDIPEFFDKGEAAIEFDQPLWKKTLDKGQDVLHLDWDSSLQIMRRTDQRVIELKCYYNREESVNRSTEKEGQCDVGGGSWVSRTGPPVNATYGLALFRHCFGNPDYDSFEVELDHDYRMVTKTAAEKLPTTRSASTDSVSMHTLRTATETILTRFRRR